MGHPTKMFQESSDRSKQQKTSTKWSRSVHSPDELFYADQMRLCFEGSVDPSYNGITNTSNKLPKCIQKNW